MPLEYCKEITGVILIGGKSRRMGKDKAFLEVDGKPIFERVLDLFRESFTKILLAGDRAERFTTYKLPVVTDIYPGSSLGGLYTGLYHAKTDYIFVASCDLPFPNAGVIKYLCSLKDGFDAVVTRSASGYEPLFALYSKNCLEPIKNQLESGDYRASAFYPHIKALYVAYDELTSFDKDGTAFVNVNTPEEFANVGGKL